MKWSNLVLPIFIILNVFKFITVTCNLTLNLLFVNRFNTLHLSTVLSKTFTLVSLILLLHWVNLSRMHVENLLRAILFDKVVKNSKFATVAQQQVQVQHFVPYATPERTHKFSDIYVLLICCQWKKPNDENMDTLHLTSRIILSTSDET